MGPSKWGPVYQEIIFWFFWYCSGPGPFLIEYNFCFKEKACCLDSSMQNHAESSRNFLKKSISEPNRAKLDQKSEHGHEYVIFADRLGPIYWAPFESVRNNAWHCHIRTHGNHSEITSKSQFWNRSVRNSIKTRHLFMSKATLAYIN